MQTIMLVIALGFPVVVFFSWAYEVTPEGIKRESEVDRSQSITHVTGRKLDYSILVVLILALSCFVWESRFSDRGRDGVETPGLETEAIVAVDAALETAPTDNRSIAVLPFDNRSSRDEDQYFTDGIHDDLLSTIAKIGTLQTCWKEESSVPATRCASMFSCSTLQPINTSGRKYTIEN